MGCRVGGLRRGARIRIRYCNAEGRRSERELRVIRTYRSRYGHTYLEAFCHLAGERRTFRADRIISIEELTPRQEPLRTYGRPHPSGAAPSREGIEPTRYPSEPPAPPPSPEPVANRLVEPREHPGRAYAIITVLSILLAFVMIRISGRSGGEPVPAIPSPTELAARRALDQPAAPAARPAPASTIASGVASAHFVYRGIAVEARSGGSTTLYVVPALEIAADTLRDAYLFINVRLFERQTRIHDIRLEALYAAADTDGNGHLSWAEIVEFQKAVYRIFAYKSNTIALRPDHFLERGGGDCDDWALFAAGLLHFWGWNAYIVTFDPPNGGPGHVVTFVKVAQPIPGIGSYTIPATMRVAGRIVPAGIYVPIDYDDVGGLTNAVGKGWRLDGFYEPESLYGRMM